MNYNAIREFIAEGRLSEAIELLTSSIENRNFDGKNEILLQSARLNSTLKEKRTGIISDEAANLVINQIANGILELLEKLEKKDSYTALLKKDISIPSKKNIKIELCNANISHFECDVLVLKYAQSFNGADKLISDLLAENNIVDIVEIQPSIGKFKIVNSKGVVNSKYVLFFGVEELWNFRYPEISNFMEKSFEVILSNLRFSQTVAFTIHGVGYGLDETEALQSQLVGLRNAVESGIISHSLETIYIVEKNNERFQRLTDYMNKISNLLGFRQTSSNVWQYSFFDFDALKHNNRFEIKREDTIQEKPFVFVAIPYKKEFDDIFYFGIQGAAHENGFLCERIDQEKFNGDTIDKFLLRIEKAKFIIAELSGSNPNVYLQIGYAWGKNKPIIFLTKDIKELQFDVKGQSCLIYDRIIDLKEELSRELKSLSNFSFLKSP